MLLRRFVNELLIVSPQRTDTLKKRLLSGARSVENVPKSVDMFRDRIKEDSVVALKAGDSKKVGVLRYLISIIDKKALSLPPGQMSETEEVAILRKELKNKEESRAMFAQGGRNDLVDDMDYEIRIVKEYLPQELSEEEVAKMVDEVVTVDGGQNFGMVMGMVMKKVAGRVGGDVVSRVVKEKMGL